MAQLILKLKWEKNKCRDSDQMMEKLFIVVRVPGSNRVYGVWVFNLENTIIVKG